MGLQRQLGFGSYETAWAWLHKLRRAMVRPDRDRLSGDVEVDETFVGGVEPGGGGRHVGKKSVVAIATEIRGRGVGRIRLHRVVDSSADSLMPFVTEAIERGATVVTDGLLSYDGLKNVGYGHKKLIIRGSKKAAHKLLPHVHLVASLLKRWLLGTHQGAVSPRHLEYYLDEFTFRFNRRSSKSRGLLFYRLVECAVSTPAYSYQALVGGTAKMG
jgi:transposase-like protein